MLGIFLRLLAIPVNLRCVCDIVIEPSQEFSSTAEKLDIGGRNTNYSKACLFAWNGIGNQHFLIHWQKLLERRWLCSASVSLQSPRMWICRCGSCDLSLTWQLVWARCGMIYDCLQSAFLPLGATASHFSCCVWKVTSAKTTEADEMIVLPNICTFMSTLRNVWEQFDLWLLCHVSPGFCFSVRR